MLRNKGQKTFISREGLNSLVLKSEVMLCARTQVRTIKGWTGIYLTEKSLNLLITTDEFTERY